MGEQIVLLFTSTKKALYKRDLLNVCCQNLGSYVEFAYQDDWVSDSVRKNVQAIQGREALIVFVEDVPPDEAGSPDAIPKRFHPLRWATIVEATKDPEGISLSLQLGKFEEFEKDPSARVQLFGQYALAGEHRPAGQRPKFVRTEASWTPSKRTEDRIAVPEHIGCTREPPFRSNSVMWGE